MQFRMCGEVHFKDSQVKLLTHCLLCFTAYLKAATKKNVAKSVKSLCIVYKYLCTYV